MNRSQVLNSYRPTALAEVEQWAEAGLPELVLREMLQREETSPYAPPPPEYLWKALDQAGKRTSEQLAAASFHEMLATAYSIQFRLHYFMGKELRRTDGHPG